MKEKKHFRIITTENMKENNRKIFVTINANMEILLNGI